DEAETTESPRLRGREQMDISGQHEFEKRTRRPVSTEKDKDWNDHRSKQRQGRRSSRIQESSVRAQPESDHEPEGEDRGGERAHAWHGRVQTMGMRCDSSRHDILLSVFYCHHLHFASY